MKKMISLGCAALALALVTMIASVSADHHEADEKKMSLEARHQIEHEGERLINRFMNLFESEHAQAAYLFTEDGTVQFGPEGGITVGAKAMYEGWSGIDSGKVEVNVLITSNIVITVTDEDNATGICYATHYQHRYPDSKREGLAGLNPPSSITQWKWEFKRVDGEWKISKLQNETLMTGLRFMPKD